MRTCDVAARLLALRQNLVWRDHDLPSGFHAAEDPQAVRDEVFALIGAEDFRFDVTILDKRKTQLHLQNEDAMYKLAWYLHLNM